MDTQDLLSNINIYNKYSRYIISKRRRETWDEICDRVEHMHIKKYPTLEREIVENFKYVRNKKVLPSMRSLQFAGKPIEVNNSRMYNCSFIQVSNYKVFSEIMFLLLSGTGVGFSVQKHHVKQLPKVVKANYSYIQEGRRYRITDSIEGWSDAVNQIIKFWFGLTPDYPIFDYSDIRPKGQRLKTGGGQAPGHEPIKTCLERIGKLLSTVSYRADTKLRPIDVHDIICHIADSVLAGGIRRSATISLFSKDDKEMLECKSGEWWLNNLQRARANNSVILERNLTTKKEFHSLWKSIENSGSGEPGIYFSNDLEQGTNPCAEISLSNYGFCNLVEVNVGNVTDQEDFNSRVRVGSFIATLQAGYTDLHYLRKDWQRQVEADSQIGVSLTGIADGIVMSLDLSIGSDIVLKENLRVSSLIGISPSVRCTTIKPSGNSSVVLKTSSGVHARHSPYYWRRMRIGKFESIYEYLSIKAPYLLEDDIMNDKDSVIKVAIKSPDTALFREEPVINFLNRVKDLHTRWIKTGHRIGENTNNVSATCSIKNNEWDLVGEWMWINRFSYNGISVLPYDGGSYPQLPFEECTEEDYLKFLQVLKDAYASGGEIRTEDIFEIEDYTNLQGESACSGGSCELI